MANDIALLERSVDDKNIIISQKSAEVDKFQDLAMQLKEELAQTKMRSVEAERKYQDSNDDLDAANAKIAQLRNDLEERDNTIRQLSECITQVE